MNPDNQLSEDELDELIGYRLERVERPEIARAVYDGIRHKFPEIPKRTACAVSVSILSRIVKVIS